MSTKIRSRPIERDAEGEQSSGAALAAYGNEWWRSRDSGDGAGWDFLPDLLG